MAAAAGAAAGAASGGATAGCSARGRRRHRQRTSGVRTFTPPVHTLPRGLCNITCGRKNQ
eukprot:6091113-Prymnesium_polylepis.1